MPALRREWMWRGDVEEYEGRALNQSTMVT